MRPADGLSVAHAAALRGKYEEMLALRDLSVRAETDPRPRLVKLAARFPGALRELDALAREEIVARIELLDRVERGEPAPRWVHAMHRFHALVRGVLFVKRSRARTNEGVADRWPDEAAEWRADVERIARPPRGRLMDLVYERLGRELELMPDEAKRLVFF